MPRLRREEHEMTVVEASNSEVANNELVMDPHNIMREAAACYEQTIENINVIESEDVHVGPRFISVAQNVETIDVAQGRVLGLKLVSPQNTKRLRCSIAVFVCWTLVVTSVLIFFILYIAIAKKPSRMDLDIHEAWYIRRDQWYANKDRGIDLLELPVSLVLIGHSALEFCPEKFDCIKKVLHIQTEHQMENRWEDIGPNFLVGGEGLVFEGRGANILGAMVKSFNYMSISIMFLGNYVNDKPTLEMFNHVNVLLQELVRKRVLTTDYVLYGQCQVIGAIVPPGPNVMDNLHHLDHWNPANKTTCERS